MLAARPLAASISTDGLMLLLLGGVAYTSGVFFYARESLRFNHAIWHIFVLAGSALHFFAILFYVIP